MAVFEAAGERDGMVNPLLYLEGIILIGYESVKWVPSLLYATPIVLVFGAWRLWANGKTRSEA